MNCLEFNEDEHVKCPNVCSNGLVKSFSDKTTALYEMVECEFCEGKGFVNKKDYDRINKLI